LKLIREFSSDDVPIFSMNIEIYVSHVSVYGFDATCVVLEPVVPVCVYPRKESNELRVTGPNVTLPPALVNVTIPFVDENEPILERAEELPTIIAAFRAVNEL
jgi:hypothetical protein